jgi:hypothetical protein
VRELSGAIRGPNWVGDADISWRRHHTGQSWQAWNDGGFIVGEVVGYGQQLRADAADEPTYWGAFARRERLAGHYATLEEAKAAVEAALA